MRSTPGLSAVSIGTCPGSSSNSPSSPGACTLSVSVCATTPFGVTRFTARNELATLGPLRQIGRLRADVVDRAGHLERLLGEVGALTGENFLEAAHCVVARDVDALHAGERRRGVER